MNLDYEAKAKVDEGRDDEAKAEVANGQDEDFDDSEVVKEGAEKGRRTRLTSRKSIGRSSPRTTIKDKVLLARYRKLEREEVAKVSRKSPDVMEFSPGPSQVIPTQMKKMMEEEIRQRVKEELKKREKHPRMKLKARSL